MEYYLSIESLGIENLKNKNKCLLSKWLFKLLSEDGVWQYLLRNKYSFAKSLSQVSLKPTDSPFWKGLVRVKEEFFSNRIFHYFTQKKVDDLSLSKMAPTRFWEGDTPLTTICILV